MYHLTLKSGNAKTGPIPVSTSNSNTCPSTCGMKKYCYAKLGPLGIHWKALDNATRGVGYAQFLRQIQALPDRILWRHNQAGDLVHKKGTISKRALNALVKANKGKKGFTYTHHTMTRKNNREAVLKANREGFTINLSADTPEQADKLSKYNIAPVVTVLPDTVTENQTTPEGRKIVVCPATQNEYTTCQTCKLCQHTNRPIIGFPAHGTKRKALTVNFYKLDKTDK